MKNDEGETLGRDLRPGSTGFTGQLDLSRVTIMGYGPDGSLVPVGTEPAPWHRENGPAPFVYALEGSQDRALMPGPVPPGEVGELGYRDPELLGRKLNSDVVMVMSDAMPRPG
ncbi:hypothetical protein NKH77_28800 [Streptomyces sp. M19]